MSNEKLLALLLFILTSAADFYIYWPDWHALAILAAIGVASFVAGRYGRRAFPWEKS